MYACTCTQLWEQISHALFIYVYSTIKWTGWPKLNYSLLRLNDKVRLRNESVQRILKIIERKAKVCLRRMSTKNLFPGEPDHWPITRD